MRDIHYQLCDVFTDRPLAGNALAVFIDADALDGATMQALGRPSTLHACARGQSDRLESVEVGGHAVIVGRGTFTLP